MGKDRLAAFSDGVIAIIITIMVLELKVPHGSDWTALMAVTPNFVSYVLSFIYLAIYWNNHHHLLHTVTRVDGLILWANSFLLFWLSLIPAATAWMGENFLVSIPTALYGGILLMPAIAYYLLQKAILRTQGPESLLANALGTDIKGKISPVLYAAAILLAFVSPWISIAIYVMVAVMWLVPDRRIESVRIVAENFSKLGVALLVFLVPEVSIRAESAPCQPVTYEHSEYTVCEVDLRRQSVKLFWKKTDGHPYEYLSSLPRALGNHSRRLLFATNGGMYRPDNSPVGLYVEEGQELVRANTSAGPGNFYMRPNGVFYLTGEVAGILETRSFIKQKPQVDFATQSGPMLVIDGEVNARFVRYGGSKKYRVAVGSRDRNLVVFAISESEVSFGEFARLFRDKLRCKNALFLDGGSATSFYSPVLGRNGNFLPLGPIIGVYGSD